QEQGRAPLALAEVGHEQPGEGHQPRPRLSRGDARRQGRARRLAASGRSRIIHALRQGGRMKELIPSDTAALSVPVSLREFGVLYGGAYYYPGTEETHVGQAFQPDFEGGSGWKA